MPDTGSVVKPTPNRCWRKIAISLISASLLPAHNQLISGGHNPQFRGAANQALRERAAGGLLGRLVPVTSGLFLC